MAKDTLKEFYPKMLSSFIKKYAKTQGKSLQGTSTQLLANLSGYMIDKIIEIAKDLMKLSKKQTLGSREILYAAKIFLTGQLGKDAEKYLNTAMAKFNNTMPEGQVNPEANNRSKAKRAGLTLPVARFRAILKDNLPYKLGAGSAIALAAIVEYVLGEIIKIDTEKKITPRDIYMRISGDEELDYLYGKTAIGGGVHPHIPRQLIKKANL